MECRITAQAGEFATEVWLPIVGHIGWQISDQGRIRDRRTKTIREPDRSQRYPRVSLDGRRRNVHTLMAESWLGPRPFGAMILHADDNPNHYAITNLAYGSREQNAADAKRNRTSVGTGPTGTEKTP